jgi:solute carrier family 45, member 1/2/4
LKLILDFLLGLILVPWGRSIADILGSNDDISIVTNQTVHSNLTAFEYETVNAYTGSRFIIALLLSVLGTLLLDFTADNCQTPSRAYLLDMCTSEEHGRGLSTFTIMAGLGGCLGYGIGAINWDNTIFANLIGDNIKTVFTLVTVIFIFSMLMTITSFREIPLKLLESDEMLRPVTSVVVKKEKERLKALDGNKQTEASISTIVIEKNEIKNYASTVNDNHNHNHNHNIHNSNNNNNNSSSSDDEDDDHEESNISFVCVDICDFRMQLCMIYCDFR